MSEIRKCEYCGKPFEKKNYIQKYCSKECKLKSNHPSQAVHEIRVCPGCGKEFETRNASSNFCSRKCWCSWYEKTKRSFARTQTEVSESAFEKLCSSLFKCGFEYVSGYHGVKSQITIRCLRCGAEKEINSDSCRDNRPIACKNCSRIEQQKVEAKKKIEAERRKTIRQMKPLEGVQIKFENCQLCGGFFVAKRKGQKYCEECSRVATNRRKDKRVEGKKRSSWTWQKLERMTGNLTCQICGMECDPNDYEIRDGTIIAGNNYPSVDHIIPLSKGGTDTYDNLQIACRYCNSHKHNRLNYERVF